LDFAEAKQARGGERIFSFLLYHVLMRSDSLFFILFLALMLGVFHNLAFEHFLYWKFWWYDIMMHFLGGAIISASLLWAILYELPERFRGRFFTLAYAVLAVFLIGIAWEVFEYAVKTDPEFTRVEWILDTLLDLCVDIAGGIFAYFTFRSIYLKHGV
jgi:hypothetical protein